MAIVQDGRIVLCNDALCRMNHYTKEEVYRMSDEEILATVLTEDRPRVIGAMQALLNGQDLPPVERIRLVDRTKRLHWVEVLAGRTA